MCLVLMSKILIGDKLQNKSKHGYSKSILCRRWDETNVYPFIECIYAKELWNKVEIIVGNVNVWHDSLLEGCFWHMFHKHKLANFQAIPYLVV